MIIYKEIYTEFSQITKRISLNTKYTSTTIQNEIIKIISYIIHLIYKESLRVPHLHDYL